MAGDEHVIGADTARGGLATLLEHEEEKLLGCVHCGFCLPACPTYVRLGDEADSPRGRLYLMRAVVEGRIEPSEDAFQTHIDRCLGCRACETVCPSGVQYGQLLEAARSAAIGAKPLPLITRVMLAVFASARLRRPVLALGRLLRGTGIARLLALLTPRSRFLRSIRLSLAMLAASGPVARSRLGQGRRAESSSPSDDAAPGTAAEARARGTVGVLAGCAQEGLFGRVNDATIRVLAANGYDVRPVRAQVCCGALHAHAGQVEVSRDLARANVRAFEEAGVDWVAVNAAGCGAAMRDYGHLLEDDPEYAERAARMGMTVRDITELLADAGPRSGAGVAVRVTYDAPCHLHHGQGVTDAPYAVMRAIPDLELLPLAGATECCGGAGIYGLTHPELGGRIGSDKVEAVVATGAELVATGNPGCMMQIGAGLLLRGGGATVVHPVELLDESYRRAGFYGRDGGRGSAERRGP